jgi:hypothetical protein
MAVAKKIDMTQWQANYVAGTQRSGQKLVTKFSSRTGMVAAATSPQAIQLMTTNVTSPLAIAKRTYKLNKQGDAGLIAGMQKTGATNYVNNTGARAPKAAAGFAPFAPILENITNTLPARTSDPASNVSNRVTPIAVGLNAAAKQIYGSS